MIITNRYCTKCKDTNIDFFSAKERKQKGYNNGKEYIYFVVDITYICPGCGDIATETQLLYK